ncbi:MAG: hypothetical protein ABIQ02_06540 [Saprospiraceae bacterium]
MKNLLLFFLVAFGLTSCSKDSLDQSIDNLLQPGKSEIMVSTTYLNWTNQCETSCINTSGETLSFIANAKVDLYSGEQNESDIIGTPIMSIKTNDKGEALIVDVEPSSYTVIIDTPLGKKSRIITTQLHRRSYIDFSF